MSSINYPLLAIPAYYIFSVVPHIYANALLAKNGYKANRANPKAAMSPAAVSGKVPDAIFQRYQRAENAHNNNVEQMPIFAAAILASVIAQRVTATGLSKEVVSGDATGVMAFVGTWFVVRTLYVAAYISISDHATAVVRSLLWVGGNLLAFWQIWKAASVLG